MAFIPWPTWRVEPRTSPAARSGWVTRPTTGWGPARSASKVGSANMPVPIITMRMRGASTEQVAVLAAVPGLAVLAGRLRRDVPGLAVLAGRTGRLGGAVLLGFQGGQQAPKL